MMATPYIYIYSDDPLRYTPERLIGQDCAVICDGEYEEQSYLKRLRRADNGKIGYFNLESINTEWRTMVNIPIKFAYPIRYTKRKI